VCSSISLLLFLGVNKRIGTIVLGLHPHGFTSCNHSLSIPTCYLNVYTDKFSGTFALLLVPGFQFLTVPFGPTLWTSDQSSWLHNREVLCFLWGTNWIYICYVEESRPPLWSSGQSSWLHIQRSGLDSRRYQIFWEVVGLKRGPLSLVSATEELLGRKSSGSGLESRDYGRRDPSRWPRGTLQPQTLALASPTSGGRSIGIVRPEDSGHGVYFFCFYCTIWCSFINSLSQGRREVANSVQKLWQHIGNFWLVTSKTVRRVASNVDNMTFWEERIAHICYGLTQSIKQYRLGGGSVDVTAGSDFRSTQLSWTQMAWCKYQVS
jgi:hypothetical protein